MNKKLSIAREIITHLKSSKNSISFQKLWESVCHKLKISEDIGKETASDFYIDLLEDPSFIKLNNNEWTLKELFSYDDVKKINSPVYPTEEFEINEEEYSEYLSNYEIMQLKEKKVDVTASLDLNDMYDSINIDMSEEVVKSSPLKLIDDDNESEGEEYEE